MKRGLGPAYRAGVFRMSSPSACSATPASDDQISSYHAAEMGKMCNSRLGTRDAERQFDARVQGHKQPCG